MPTSAKAELPPFDLQTFEHIERLELAAKESADWAHAHPQSASAHSAFIQHLEQLRREYQARQWTQQEAWALARYGYEGAAQGLESSLVEELRTLPIEAEHWPIKNFVKAARLRNGRKVIIRNEDEFVATNDALFYAVNRVLGFNLVPVTILRQVEGERVSLQVYVENFRGGDLITGGYPTEVPSCTSSIT